MKREDLTHRMTEATYKIGKFKFNLTEMFNIRLRVAKGLIKNWEELIIVDEVGDKFKFQKDGTIVGVNSNSILHGWSRTCDLNIERYNVIKQQLPKNGQKVKFRDLDDKTLSGDVIQSSYNKGWVKVRTDSGIKRVKIDQLIVK